MHKIHHMRSDLKRKKIQILKIIPGHLKQDTSGASPFHLLGIMITKVLTFNTNRPREWYTKLHSDITDGGLDPNIDKNRYKHLQGATKVHVILLNPDTMWIS